MRYYKTQHKYKASNLELDMNTMQAYSYGWWIFLSKIEGNLVFNDFPYSITTMGHQRKILKQLELLGIIPSIYVECPGGLQNLTSGISHYTYYINGMKDKLQKPRIRQTTKDKLKLEIAKAEEKLEQLSNLIKES